ncbi:MAG: NADH:flavin oxidoreductase, Old Yellow Enzyme family [Firmicutes bacterium]|nr:NADH:flavin oxidoreductase, Old Yellow Enzyme family [Bacillota bacterium]
MKEYPNLFSPIKIGNVIFKNRLVMAPLTSDNCVVDNRPSEQSIAFYSARARGGFAQVTLGEVDVDTDYACRTDAFNIISDPNPKYWHSGAYNEVTMAIKEHGAIASIEINHTGEANHPKNIIDHKNPIGPTGHIREDGITIDEMDEAMMNQVADNFAKAAQYVELIGFNMCMVHGGHGWLLGQFLSPLTNKRTDKYGGSQENRARFPLMVIDRIRQAVGKNFLIEYRVSGEELVDGGLTIDDVVDFAKRIENKVDIIHVSVGIYHLHVESRTFSSMYHPHGCNVHLAEAIKKAVSTPVAVVGGINDPAMAEQIIAEGKADLVALGRQALADPEFPNKAITGRTDEIAPCLRCGCFSPMPQEEGKITPPHTFQCTVNPVTSKEFRMQLEPAAKSSKKVMIVGGGPGGMYAAITAAERGHKVTLFEKTNSLGGALKFTDYDRYKDDLRRYKDSLITRINKLNITVKLNTEVTTNLVEQENPDALIVAVGSSPIVPNVSGIAGSNVMQALDVYWNPERVGAKVVMIGGGLVGCETGLHLAALGKSVTVVEMMDKLAPDATESHRIALFDTMDGKITAKTETKCIAITSSGITVVNKAGVEEVITADTIVYAVGMRAHSNMAFELCKAAPKQYFFIGDCVSPRKVKQAVHEGFHAAMDVF